MRRSLRRTFFRPELGKQSRSPGKFPRPFIRPSKQICRLLASLLYNGQASFPTLLPFSGAGKFSLSAHPMPYAKFFTHNLSIKRHKVAFMRMWISYYSSRTSTFIFSKDVNKLLIIEVVNWKLDLLVPSLLLFFALTRRVRRDRRLLPILLCRCFEDFSHIYPSGREYVLKQTAFSLLDNALWMKQVWYFCFI